MRFTVKTKLAGAFGAVIILTVVTGGVAYTKLNQLAATSADLVVRAGRGDKAAEIQASILSQVRAEKNLIIASNDADIAQYAADIKKSARDRVALGQRSDGRHDGGRQSVAREILRRLRKVERRRRQRR